jgi:transcriptional regulator with AAA-type ATPase domain/transcriptional regulatory protein LevR
MNRLIKVYDVVKKLCEEQLQKNGKITGVTTQDIVKILNIQRSNASSDLNALVQQGKLEKIKGKPVIYRIIVSNASSEEKQIYVKSVFDQIIGANESLKTAIQQAKAAIMYPPMGLHTLLLGETGVGKSMFAELMFRYACEIGRLKKNAPFVVFNCADYANNPQLLISQLFGVKKGAYTGADKDKAGLVAKADGGVLLLDEVHRLPPEGQEMLFYLMDKGLYRSLGEVDACHEARVMIICATTENIESALLKTFLRRIPTIIKLPPLRERTLKERWHLIKEFFKQEAVYLKTSITVSSNALKAFLLYDCPNNIGQLKNDIKLSCARAFLNYKVIGTPGLNLHSADLPEYVRAGLLKYKDHREKINEIGLTDNDVVFVQNRYDIDFITQNGSLNIYEQLENKMKSLQEKGLSEAEIQLIMSLEMESYVKKYMAKIEKDNFEQLYKVVDRKIVELSKEFINLASQKLAKNFSDKVIYGLSTHVSGTLKRIRNGKMVFNPHMEEIKKSHPIEYKLAVDFCGKLKYNFQIDIPEDEAGFITMFLVMDDYADEKVSGKVGIIVAMHGESCATSMADVANKLLGVKHAVGYNMPLDQKPETALENLTQLVKQVDEGTGVLLLVDMGSLVFFGDMIYERTRIPIRTVEMVSTLMVLEATRKALMFASLEEIYYAATTLSPYLGRMVNGSEFKNNPTNDVIITACLTGQGAAIMLKEILEKQLGTYAGKLDILPIEIVDSEEYNRKLSMIKKEKNIIAVVSSIKPRDAGLIYISPQDLIEGRKIDLIKWYMYENEKIVKLLENMKDVIKDNLNIDAEKFTANFINLYFGLKSAGIDFDSDILVGLVLHMACAVERLIQGKRLFKMKDEKQILDKYKDDIDVIKRSLKPLEEAFHIELPPVEIANIIKLAHFV